MRCYHVRWVKFMVIKMDCNVWTPSQIKPNNKDLTAYDAFTLCDLATVSLVIWLHFIARFVLNKTLHFTTYYKIYNFAACIYCNISLKMNIFYKLYKNITFDIFQNYWYYVKKLFDNFDLGIRLSKFHYKFWAAKVKNISIAGW